MIILYAVYLQEEFNKMINDLQEKMMKIQLEQAKCSESKDEMTKQKVNILN